MGKRRAQGEGAVYQTSDGRWRAAVDLGWVNGKRQRKYLSGRTKAEVVRKLRRTHASLDRGEQLPDDMLTVEQWLCRWLEEVAPQNRSESTVETYRRGIEGQIIPGLGKIKLAKLSPQVVHKWLQDLVNEGYAERTVRRLHGTLSAAITDAQRWEIVNKNVCSLVSPPSAPEATHDALALDEAHALLEAAESHRLGLIVSGGLPLGLRRGELLRLRWEHIDFEDKTLSVPGTKSSSARTTVPVPNHTMDAFRRHKTRQTEERLAAGSKWRDSGYVLTTEFGHPLKEHQIRTEFLDICEKAGLGHRRLHALRHSAATLLYEQGVPIEVISHTLRHAGINVTHSIYTQLRPQVHRTAADAMDALFGEGS